MSIDDAIRQAVTEVVREVVREEVRAAMSAAAPAPAPSSFLTVAAAARHASVHPATIREWVRARRLPEHRAGRELRVRLDELEAAMARGRGANVVDIEARAVAMLGRRRR